MFRLYAVAMIGCIFALVGCQSQGSGVQEVPAQPRVAQPRQIPALLPVTGKVYLVSVDGVSRAALQEVAAWCKKKWGTKIQVLPSLSSPPAAFDSGRQQLIGDQMLGVLQQHYAPKLRDPNDVLIGVTADDMYTSSHPDWRYVFSTRADNAALVSTARMSLPSGSSTGPGGMSSIMTDRLHKMVGKQIGVLYYHLPTTSDPRSILYNNIMGPDDLDNMSDNF